MCYNYFVQKAPRKFLQKPLKLVKTSTKYRGAQLSGIELIEFGGKRAVKETWRRDSTIKIFQVPF